MDELKKELATKWQEQKDALDLAIKGTVSKDDYNKLLKEVKDQGQDMADFIENNKVAVPEDFESKFESFLHDNMDELKTIIKQRTGEVEFIFDAPVDKVVGDMTTGSGGDAMTAPPNHNTVLSRVRLRDDNPLINLCNTIRTSKVSFPYTEMSPKDGDYAFVAEGTLKPQIDFTWAVRYAEPYKIAAYEIFTDEVIRDIPRMMDTARGYLKDKHDLFKATALYFSDGTGELPTGATVYARLFVAGAMALSIIDPTIMDVINAVVTDIYTTHNYTDEPSYQPNLVLLNPVDFFVQFQAAKDSNRWALYSGVELFNTFQVGGMTIKPWEKIPAGKIFVGDMSKYNISNWVRYAVRLGFINDQLITNKFTMVGESRFHAFVKNFDVQAFVYDDIATIASAIKAV